jgi:hypothetical protein
LDLPPIGCSFTPVSAFSPSVPWEVTVILSSRISRISRFNSHSSFLLSASPFVSWPLADRNP